MSEYLVVALLALIALAAVAYPLLVGYSRYDDDADLDADLDAYRTALQAGTICSRCRFANREGSRFCADCGRALERE